MLCFHETGRSRDCWPEIQNLSNTSQVLWLGFALEQALARLFVHVLYGVGVVFDDLGFHYVYRVAFPFQDAAQPPGHGEVRLGQFPDVAGVGVLIDAGDHLVAVLVGDVLFLFHPLIELGERQRRVFAESVAD